jgi:hypothetical protein
MATVASFFLVGYPALAGELYWYQHYQRATAPVGQREIEARFRCFNRGPTPVRIKHIHVTCGCTSAVAMDPVIAPGAEGAISVTADIQSLIGTKDHLITVLTEDGEACQLTLCAAVPALGAFDAPALVWKAGGDFEAKTIRFLPSPESGAEFVSIDFSASDLGARITRRGADGELEISVRPIDKTKPLMTHLVAVVKTPQGLSKRHMCPVCVQPAAREMLMRAAVSSNGRMEPAMSHAGAPGRSPAAAGSPVEPRPHGWIPKEQGLFVALVLLPITCCGYVVIHRDVFVRRDVVASGMARASSVIGDDGYRTNEPPT